MVKKVPKLVNVVCERPLIANKIRKNKPFSVKFCLQTLIKFESQLTPCLQPLPSPITKWIKTNKKIITIKTMTITIMVWFIRYFHQSGIPNLRNLLTKICYSTGKLRKYTPVLNQMKVFFLFQLLKRRKICQKKIVKQIGEII